MTVLWKKNPAHNRRSTDKISAGRVVGWTTAIVTAFTPIVLSLVKGCDDIGELGRKVRNHEQRINLLEGKKP